jgi:hypothetical protein
MTTRARARTREEWSNGTTLKDDKARITARKQAMFGCTSNVVTSLAATAKRAAPHIFFEFFVARGRWVLVRLDP